MKSKVFISIYRFDTEYLDFIDRTYKNSTNTFVSLFELKNKGMKSLIKTFISYKKYDEIVIVFNDENYKLLEGLFYTLSLFIVKSNIKRILPDKTVEKVTIWDRLGAVVKMIGSAIATKRLVKKVEQEIKLQNDKPKVKLNKESKIYYLKTNLSFGTKAGGSLGHISGVVNALSKRSKLSYISAESPIMIDEEIAKESINLSKVVYSIPYELNSVKINEAFLEQCDTLMKEQKPDIIYQRLTLFNYAGAYLSNKYKIPLIIEYNGSEVWVQNNWGTGGLKYSRLALGMEEYVLRSADTIITVSKVLQEELIERGFDKDKIVFYPNCIDERVFDHHKYEEVDKLQLRQELGFEQHDKIFTFIGTFGAWHGVEFLAQSIVKLVANHKESLDRHRVKFLLIGDGLLGEKVRDMLGASAISPYVVFTGLIPQMEAPKYLSISDCFLSPHIRQKEKFIGSPTKLFEYMAFAKPIIASDLDQVGEVFEHKLFAKDLAGDFEITQESAIVFEPDNHNEFMKSILFVAENNAIDRLGKNAYDMVMHRYTWSVHVEKIVKKFNSR